LDTQTAVHSIQLHMNGIWKKEKSSNCYFITRYTSKRKGNAKQIKQARHIFNVEKMIVAK